VFVPIRIGPRADEVLKFAERVVKELAADHPRERTVELTFAARGNRVCLDGFGMARCRPWLAPIGSSQSACSGLWHGPRSRLPLIRDVQHRKFRTGLKKKDPWADFFESRQALGNWIKRGKKV
jgi:DNA primase